MLKNDNVDVECQPTASGILHACMLAEEAPALICAHRLHRAASLVCQARPATDLPQAAGAGSTVAPPSPGPDPTIRPPKLAQRAAPRLPGASCLVLAAAPADQPAMAGASMNASTSATSGSSPWRTRACQPLGEHAARGTAPGMPRAALDLRACRTRAASGRSRSARPVARGCRSRCRTGSRRPPRRTRRRPSPRARCARTGASPPRHRSPHGRRSRHGRP